MRIFKNGKLTVKNCSSIILNEELNECVKILPIEYRKVNAHLFIHKDYRGYFKFCIKNLRLVDLFCTRIRRIFKKIKKDTITEAIYSISKNEIHIFEDKVRQSILIRKKEFEKLDRNFIKILKAEGIHVYHQYEDEMYIGFKYNITYKSNS